MEPGATTNADDEGPGHVPIDEYEGRLIAGPFRSGLLQDVEKSLRRHGVLCHKDGRRGSWSRVTGGYELHVEGAGIRGYFVDSEGLEVSQSDLDAAIMATVAPETDFHIRGLHQVDEDRMVAVSMKARHDGVSVIWGGSRSIISNDKAPDVSPVNRLIPEI